jgi:hypothetical protein
MILQGSFQYAFSQISVRGGIYIRRQNGDSTPASGFSKLSNYLHIFHEVFSPETTRVFEKLPSAKIPLIAVGKVE